MADASQPLLAGEAQSYGVAPSDEEKAVAAKMGAWPPAAPPLSEQELAEIDRLLADMPKPGGAPAGASTPPRLWQLSRVELAGRGIVGHAPPSQEEVSRFGTVLSKLEIVRDFLQILSLLSFVYPGNFDSVFGNVSQTVAVDFRSLLAKAHIRVAPYLFFLLEIIIGFIALGWMVRLRRADPEQQREGLEVRTWGRRSKWELLRNKIVATVLTTLFLPIMQNVVQVLVWQDVYWPTTGTDLSGEPFQSTSCYEGGALLVVVAVVAGLVFGLYLPYFLYKTIEFSRPKSLRFTTEGHTREFTNEDYAAALERDRSPYKFLYEGFEQRFAFYKVLVMGFKMLLILTTTVPQANNCIFANYREEHLLRTSTILTTLVLAGNAAVSTRLQPFIDWTEDLLDSSGAVTNAFTSFIGIFLTFGVWKEHGWGIILVVFNCVNIVIMLTPYVAKSGYLKTRLKMLRRQLEWSAGDADGVPLVFSEALRLTQELKARVWRPFFDGLFFGEERFRPPKEQRFEYAERISDHGYAYLLDFRGTVGERHAENKHIVELVGRAQYEEALARDADEAAQRVHEEIGARWHGVDMYFNGLFGKAFLVPFPFRVNVACDNGSNASLTMPHDLQRYAAENSSDAVGQMRALRIGLRALHQTMVYFHYEETRSKTKSRTIYVQQYNPSTGGYQQVPQQQNYSVQVHFTFSNGVLTVQSEKELMWRGPRGETLNVAPGFQPVISYKDGRGVDHEGKEWTNEAAVIGGDKIGWDGSHKPNPTLDRLMRHPGNAQKVHAGMPHVQAVCNAYREFYVSEHRRKRDTLSYQFWSAVYESPVADADTLRSRLAVERNPLVRELDGEATHFLLSRMAFLTSHPARAFWFVVFDDLWTQNQDLLAAPDKDTKRGADTEPRFHRDEFDPARADSLCFRPMPPAELLRFLEAAGLAAPPGAKQKRGYVGPELVATLYRRMLQARF